MKRHDGHGGDTPTCETCGAYMQTLGPDGWRCPWVKAGEIPPDDGPWCCTWPYSRTHRPDTVRAFGIASSPSA